MAVHTNPQSYQRSTQVIEIVVIGLHNSGKTKFIETVSQYTEWQSEPGRSWYFGRVSVDAHLILHFLEPPNGEGFDFIWIRDLINSLSATGYIVMVDSTRPKNFGEFLSILCTIRSAHPMTPCIVAANKQDHPRAWSADDIRMGIGIGDDVEVLPCVATNREAVKSVVLKLLYKLNI